MYAYVNQMSDNWRLSDPDYTDFEPVTVQQAILRFRRQGLNPWRYPECFIECAEAWVVNPTGEPSAVYAEADEKWQDGSPPVPVHVKVGKN